MLFSTHPILLRRENVNPPQTFSGPNGGLEITSVLHKGATAVVAIRCQVPVQVTEFVGFMD